VWRGRLERRSWPDGRTLWLDAAHNPAGAAALASYLGEFVPEGLPIVFAIMRDKDVAGTLGPILPFASPLIVTRPDTARAMAPDTAAAVARRLGRDRGVAVEPDVGRALAAAWRRADRIAACGSIFLVGEALDRLGLPAW
jgi:dihydrofolate synthase/folylpolyglutamate synthase